MAYLRWRFIHNTGITRQHCKQFQIQNRHFESRNVFKTSKLVESASHLYIQIYRGVHTTVTFIHPKNLNSIFYFIFKFKLNL